MKIRNMLIAVATIGAACALPATADCGKCETSHGDKKPHATSMSSQSEGFKMKSMRLSKIMDANLKSKDGKSLGELEDLVIDSQTGKIELAVVGQGGVLGVGESLVAVPWSSISASSEKEFTVNVDEQRLKSGPKLDKDYSNLNDQDFAATVARFYASDSAVGGSESLEDKDLGGTKGSGSSAAEEAPQKSE